MERRNFLTHSTAIAASMTFAAGIATFACGEGSAEASRENAPRGTMSGEPGWEGTVLQAEDGRFIVSGRRRAPMRVKVDSARVPGVAMSMLVAEVAAGLSIPVHRHGNEDEIIFIHTGEGVVTLGEQRVPSSAGAMLYAPRGVWHGVENTGIETLTWCAIWSPAGFEQYFIEAAQVISRPAGPATARELDELAARYGMEFRDI